MDKGLLSTIFKAINADHGRDEAGEYYGTKFMRFRLYPFKDARERGLKSGSIYTLSDIALITAERLNGSPQAFNDLVCAIRESAYGRAAVISLEDEALLQRKTN